MTQKEVWGHLNKVLQQRIGKHKNYPSYTDPAEPALALPFNGNKYNLNDIFIVTVISIPILLASLLFRYPRARLEVAVAPVLGDL